MAVSDRETYLQGLRSQLTKNQRIFCDEYLIDRNGTQSYLVAYPNTKKKSTASVSAHHLLRKPKIKEYINERLKDIAKKSAVTVERILQEESLIAFSDMRQLFDGGFVQIAPGDLPENIARAVAGIEIKEKVLYTTDDDETVMSRTYKYKLWDKGGSLNRLEKHLGMHQDNKNVGDSLEALGDRLAAAIERVAGK